MIVGSSPGSTATHGSTGAERRIIGCQPTGYVVKIDLHGTTVGQRLLGPASASSPSTTADRLLSPDRISVTSGLPARPPPAADPDLQARLAAKTRRPRNGRRR